VVADLRLTFAVGPQRVIVEIFGFKAIGYRAWIVADPTGDRVTRMTIDTVLHYRLLNGTIFLCATQIHSWMFISRTIGVRALEES
jgi:hypothetical protein